MSKVARYCALKKQIDLLISCPPLAVRHCNYGAEWVMKVMQCLWWKWLTDNDGDDDCVDEIIMI